MGGGSEGKGRKIMELSRNTFPADRWCDRGREGMSRKDFFKVECSGLCFSFSYSSPVSNAEMSTEVQLMLALFI